MADVIVAEALKLLEGEGLLQKNSDIHNFYDKFSTDIENAFDKYKSCKKQQEKEREAPKEKQIKSNTICTLKEDNISLNAHVEEFKSDYTHDSNRCDYLLYWMSDKIDMCKNNFHCIIWLDNIFAKFWKDSICCGEKVTDSKKCEKPFVIEVDKIALKNKRELYQFLEYYKSIENAIKEKKAEKKETFCRYIKYMFDLYHVIDNEYNKNLNKYSEELKYFQRTFKDSDELSNLKIVCNYPNLSVTSQRDGKKLNLSSEANFERLITIKDDFSKHVIQAPSEMDDILKNSPSYKLYKEFDSVVNDTKINEDCKNHFKDKSTYQDKSIETCNKILCNFKKLYNNTIKIKTDNPCLHYKYWVYKEILKMIKDNNEYKNIKEIIEKFLDLQFKKNIPSDPNKIACHYYYIFKDLIELNTKIEEKDLHDYFKYYDNLHHMVYLISLINGKDKEAYMERKSKFPVVLIGDEVLPNKLTEDDVMRIQYGRCTYVYDPNNNEKIFGKRCDYVASPEHFENFYNNLPDGKKKVASQPISETESSTVNMSDLSGISNTEENESNPVSYKIPTSVALGLGTVFVFFIYYKFTPLGSFFGKRDLGGRSFEDDFNEEYMQEFSYDSEYEDVNTHNRRIHIAYQRE
ncbi:PIR Superfamily Protein [Plasmodium ovale wallikeri]|uniref:PIR Superfamily Protein n=1 Tax=Plasmodium ovale wallikeri TaxID=864142 RepID=A0A1A9AGS5_PLAOA|nr:PIR Superfamily Protein [Plasmodium ovale wallikeri]